tara:strand:+ start:1083 stop:2225 length:1143 start_codon:yes stop_codon:yes gene_type:complete
MANIKFSQFTADGNIDGGSVTAKGSETSFLVGYDTTGNTNNMWTFPQIAEGLAAHTTTPYSIYSANGTVSGNRIVTISGSNKLDFYAGGTQLLQLWGSSSGQFTLGRGASIGVGGAWCIGNSAEGKGSGAWCIGNSSVSRSQYNTVVGNSATDTATTNTYNTIIGSSASVTGASNAANVVIGDSALATTSGGVAVGSEARANGSKSISLGQRAQGTGNNSITLNANGGAVAPSTANAFGVYMSSNTTPDLEVIGGGESTLNTSLKITGQAYTELHTGVTGVSPNWNDGNIQEITLANLDEDFDPDNAKAGATYILKIKQPSSGAAGTINWNAASATVYWPSPGEPTLSTGNNQVDIVTLICTAGGVSGGTYYANATLTFS